MTQGFLFCAIFDAYKIYMEFTIRNAKSGDMQQVLALIKELAAFEREPDAVEITEKDLQTSGFGTHPAFQCFVAEVKGEIVGAALVYQRFSTWKGVILHLEDLIVSQQMRGFGIGNALLDKVIVYGAQMKVKRICWEVLDWNTPAIEFYKKNGAPVKEDWRVVQMDEKSIATYMSKLKNESI